MDIRILDSGDAEDYLMLRLEALQQSPEAFESSFELTLEYDPQPLYNSGDYSKANEEVIKMSEDKLKESAKKELGVTGLLKHSKELYKM